MRTLRVINVLFVLLLFGMLFLLLNYKEKTYDQYTITDKIKNKYNVNVLINGDSIGGGTNPDDWCMLLQSKLDDTLSSKVQVVNISVPGWNSFAGITRLTEYKEENINQAFIDLIILCYGQNDLEDDDFPIYYEALIRTCKKNYPNSAIVSVVESSIVGESLKREVIIELCNYYSIPYVDMLKAYKDTGKEYVSLTEDWIHPNKEGKQLYADRIFEVVKNNYIDKKYVPKDMEKPLYEDSVKYSDIKYIPAERLSISGTNIVVDIGNNKYTGFGVDILLSDHTVQFATNNGNKYSITWEGNYQARRIIDVDSEVSFEKGVTLKFNTPEDALAIKGVVLYGTIEQD